MQKRSTMRTRAVVTVSLSATGSRKAPNLEQRLYLRAMKPSARSVRQERLKIRAAVKSIQWKLSFPQTKAQ